MSVNLYINRIEAFGENYNFKFIFVGGLLSFTFLWLTLGILRRRILKITLEKDTLEVKSLFLNKLYNFEDFHGYYTTLERSKAGEFEVMNLSKKDGKKLLISEFIYTNYSSLKSRISDNLKDLGRKPYSYLEDLKDTFS